jgi:hypothetical protein
LGAKLAQPDYQQVEAAVAAAALPVESELKSFMGLLVRIRRSLAHVRGCHA